MYLSEALRGHPEAQYGSPEEPATLARPTNAVSIEGLDKETSHGREDARDVADGPSTKSASYKLRSVASFAPGWTSEQQLSKTAAP